MDAMENGAEKGPKKKTIEDTYQKKSQLEHILLRPDTYIGSVEFVQENQWIYDKENKKMVQKEIKYVPGLYKIFDEILVNAADNKQRDSHMNEIRVEITDKKVSVWNNGEGIPIQIHKGEKMYVPTMIFGHLLTSSNYDDSEEKVTGGRNGYGAKLCNIFSHKFIVETASRKDKKKFKQEWRNNMLVANEPSISDCTREDYTKITFEPDLSKFKMETLDDDIIALMSRRAFDVAASTRVKVILNGTQVPVKNFKDYVDLFIKDQTDDIGNPLKLFYEQAGERWEVAITLSDSGFQQMSFVNSIATTKGGRHVEHVTDIVTKKLVEVVKKKNKTGAQLKPHAIKSHMWVFVNCLINNPSFDSQTKENMTLQVKSFGSKCELSDKFINNVLAKSGIVEAILSWAKHKADVQLQKLGPKSKQKKLTGIAKLDDANDAGTGRSIECTLILTEGDSAKSFAVCGLSTIGRDKYGIFPLRGKLLNVREATHKQILENAEINNLVKILGLQYKKKYETRDDMKTLRYGKVMIMTDQDQDGSHIKGLLINFIHHNWPSLLKQNYIEEFITPLLKAKKGKRVEAFFSIPEFEEWMSNTADYHTWEIKYYKGLGTSSSVEIKEYFANIERHRIKFRYNNEQDDLNIMMAFSKKCVDQRKEWLTNHMEETKRRKEIGLGERYLYEKDTRTVTFSDFVNLELVLFSNYDNVRSIPSMVDGLKPGQRKILFACLNRSDKKEIKVAQLASYVAGKSAYHHGETSLQSTIVNMAQDYVGSNNINLLMPNGQFGTRLNGGKDAASARYIYTKLSPITSLIFNKNDFGILKYEYDENQKVEPVHYVPIIPMVLVNGADGIGTGWMTKIPNHDPREIVKNLFSMLDGNDPRPMKPFYKNFIGTIEPIGDYRYIISGKINVIGEDKVEIVELPVGTWTTVYKEQVLDPMLAGTDKAPASITGVREYSSDTSVHFIIEMTRQKLLEFKKEGLYKVFKLQTTVSTTSMCAFDNNSCLKKYDSSTIIMKDFFNYRLEMYQKRKDYLVGLLQAEASKLSNQSRFILEKCDGVLVVENKKKKDMIAELIRKKYDSDPVAALKMAHDKDEVLKEVNENAEDENVATAHEIQNENFDYLLGMAMWNLTKEKKDKLLEKRDEKLSELRRMEAMTPKQLWRNDLDELLIELDKFEKHELKDKPKQSDKVKKQLEKMYKDGTEYIAPVIDDDMKKKIERADVLTKDKKEGIVKKPRGKKAAAVAIKEEEKDEFDAMVDGSKPLDDRLGVAKSTKKTKKQTDLKSYFSAVEKKVHEYSDSDDEFRPKVTSPKKRKSDTSEETPKKAVKKPRKKKNVMSDSESDAGFTPSPKSKKSKKNDSGSELELEESPPPRETVARNRKPVKYNIDSDSDSVD